MSRGKAAWLPLSQLIDAGIPEGFMIVVTNRDGRNAMGFLRQHDKHFAAIVSPNGEVTRTFGIDGTQAVLLPLPKWEFGVGQPKLPLAL